MNWSDPGKVGWGAGEAHPGEGQQDSPGLTGFHQLGVRTWKDAKNTPSVRTM